MSTFSQPPFWLVWNEDGRVPTKKHPSIHLAEDEARRLAEANPGRSFVVLSPTARFTKQSILIERFEHDALPF